MSLIKLYRLPAPTPVASEQWPFPVKLYFLGRFSLVVDGKPQIFSAKSAARPLDMLRCLIAMGGRQVSQQALIEALWPDSEGDAAGSTFHATLHRLRKLLVVDDAIILKDGYLSLDARRIWVDVWVLERSLSLLDDAIQRGAVDVELDGLADQVLRLYKGAYAAPDSGDVQSLGYRERLQRRMLHSLGRLGKAHAARDVRAIAIWERILEIDDAHEPAYQELMLLYGRQGRNAEVAATYLRCRKVMSRKLGVMPSERTVSLYQGIARDSDFTY